jgi:energy-coupling factor transporter ATP-binding protein EcfA2
MNKQQVSINELNSLLEMSYTSPKQTPVMIYGPPGVGKSALVAAFAEKVGRKLVTVNASSYLPVDIKGMPYVYQDEVKWAIPRFVSEAQGNILFLDELTSASPDVQAVLLRLILQGETEAYRLSDTFIVAAGNEGELAAGYGSLTAPMLSRFNVVSFAPTVQDIVQGLRFGWKPGQPPFSWINTDDDTQMLWVNRFAQAVERVGTPFASPEEMLSDDPYPCPRSFENACGLLIRYNPRTLLDIERLIAVACGRTFATQMVKQFSEEKLPTPSEVMEDPKKLDEIKRPDSIRSVLTSLIGYGVAQKQIKRCMGVIEQYAQKQQHNDIILEVIVNLTQSSLMQSPLNVLKELHDGIEPIFEQPGFGYSPAQFKTKFFGE